MRFKKRPEAVDAVQYNGPEHFDENDTAAISKLWPGVVLRRPINGLPGASYPYIREERGDVLLRPLDWIVVDDDGRCFQMSNEDFYRLYEEER